MSLALEFLLLSVTFAAPAYLWLQFSLIVLQKYCMQMQLPCATNPSLAHYLFAYFKARDIDEI